MLATIRELKNLIKTYGFFLSTSFISVLHSIPIYTSNHATFNSKGVLL